MNRSRQNTPRKPATKFPQLRKKMEKQRAIATKSKTKIMPKKK